MPPWIVTAAYGVSWAYLIGDVSWTTYKSSQLGPSPLEAANMSEPTRLTMVAVKRSVFQGIASMALPAFTIHTAVKQAGKQFAKSSNVTLKRWGPTMVGIGIVPALPYLFDHPVSPRLPAPVRRLLVHVLNPRSKRLSTWRSRRSRSNTSGINILERPSRRANSRCHDLLRKIQSRAYAALRTETITGVFTISRLSSDGSCWVRKVEEEISRSARHPEKVHYAISIEILIPSSRPPRVV